MTASCAAGSARRDGTAGFTLLELMVVLVLVALFAGAALPQLGLSRGPSSDLIARDLVATLRDSRVRAITRRQNTVFWLGLDSRTYGIGPGAPHRLPSDTKLAMWSVADRAAGERGSIEFYPDGGASGGRIAIERNGRRSLVAVDWLSGAVSRAE
jgi:general secretion pathway protein H